MTSLPTRFLGICVLLLTCGEAGLLAEGVKGRPIEYSVAPGEQGKSEETRLMPAESRPGPWESALPGPFQGLTPGNSLGGAILPAPLPMPPSAVQSPRARELSDKKRDWMFLTPEELFSIETVEDKYKVPELTPDGRSLDDLRPMARAYYDAADAAYSNSTSPRSLPAFGASYDSVLGNVLSGFNPGGTVPSLNNPAGDELRSLLARDSAAGNPRATDFFKFNTGYKAPPRPTQADMQRAEEFRQILDFTDSVPDATVMNTEHMFSSPYVDPSFFDPPKPAVPPPVATLGGGAGGSSLGAASAPSWTANPPPAEPTRVKTTPASPFISIPQRNF